MKMMNKLVLTLGFLVGTLFSCVQQPLLAQMVNPNQVYNAQGHTAYLTIPEPYQDWWKEMEKCAGVESPISDWKFVVVYADAMIAKNDSTRTMLAGATMEVNRRIYLVKAIIGQRVRVQHEMLHALLYSAGQPWLHGTTADSTFDKCSYR